MGMVILPPHDQTNFQHDCHMKSQVERVYHGYKSWPKETTWPLGPTATTTDLFIFRFKWGKGQGLNSAKGENLSLLAYNPPLFPCFKSVSVLENITCIDESIINPL